MAPDRYAQAIEQLDQEEQAGQAAGRSWPARRVIAVDWWQMGGGVPDPDLALPPIRTATYATTIHAMILARPSRRRLLDHLLGPAEADAVLAGHAVLRPDMWRLLYRAIELAEAVAPVRLWSADQVEHEQIETCGRRQVSARGDAGVAGRAAGPASSARADQPAAGSVSRPPTPPAAPAPARAAQGAQEGQESPAGPSAPARRARPPGRPPGRPKGPARPDWRLARLDALLRRRPALIAVTTKVLQLRPGDLREVLAGRIRLPPRVWRALFQTLARVVPRPDGG